MFSPQGTLEMNIFGLAGEKVKSPGWDAAREADKAVRDLESVNVFYVAMTRARDLVVLSGAGTKDSKGWLKISEKFLEKTSPGILRKLRFSEMPESKVHRPAALDFRQKVEFQPLEIPKNIERKPVTNLVESLKPKAQGLKPSPDRRAFGTAGHFILEELAKNGWVGDIPALVELFGGVGNGLLVKQLEAARAVLRQETEGAAELFAEHPFVLKRGDVILDGTIDLLAGFSNGWKLFDYKFTHESPDIALETYSPQLAAYREAIKKLYPQVEVSAALVLIGETVEVISLRV
jgi:ATP-dependent exoDNAse (exonuclease V) beta subunit